MRFRFIYFSFFTEHAQLVHLTHFTLIKTALESNGLMFKKLLGDNSKNWVSIPSRIRIRKSHPDLNLWDLWEKNRSH